jgi:5-methylcytosine-specific restriction protein B
MLFLFEYRNTPVRTLYRPDDPFELSKDIWFIGTMNTADRSIALVDAALRRRFHFVPFFPNHGPMAGLLDRWLKREGEPAWVGELVAQVNDELEQELGGPHLQLGPSHFMKSDLDQDALRHRALHRRPILRRRSPHRPIPIHTGLGTLQRSRSRVDQRGAGCRRG